MPAAIAILGLGMAIWGASSWASSDRPLIGPGTIVVLVAAGGLVIWLRR